FLFSANFKKELELVNFLSEIDKRCTENTILISELRSFPSERILEQMLSVSASIDRYLEELISISIYERERSLINKIHDRAENIKDIGKILSEHFRREGFSVSIREDDKFFLYTSQLMADTNQINQGTFEIINNANAQLIEYLKMARIAIITILIIFLLLTVYQLRLVNFKILTPMRLLDQALKNIHSGDFGHRINYESDDEIGTVANVFNEMSDNLAQSTVSREELEEELIMRKKAENELLNEKAKAMDLMKEAQAANNTKDIFLANMSHEMRTPLTGIMGSLELLEEQDLKEDAQYILSLCKESAAQMNRIIDDLLEVSRISKDKYEIHKEFFDLNECLESSYKLFLISAKEKGLQYTFNKSDLPKKVYSDKKRIMQIMNNLISNAIKFTPEGSVQISVDFKKKSETNGALHISVKDTGIGIEKDVQDQIYDFFYQKDMSFTKDYQGMGVGLTIVKNIINSMNGEIALNTQRGKGTKFSAIIPMTYTDVKVDTDRVDTLDTHKEKGKTKRILIIEDNKINRVIIRKMLVKHDYSVEEAVDGRDGLEKLDQLQSVDLILMDIQMPVMDGYEARIAIRRKYGENSPPMIALTGYSSDDDKRKISEAGFEGYLGKPYNESELLKVIHQVQETNDS
ncbi:MAG: ATP-binding protein, partial [Thermotogota bacterium]